MSEQTKVLTAVDKATRAMAKASADLTKVSFELQRLTESTDTLSTEIEFKQSELDEIVHTLEIKAREAAADLALRVKEDRAAVLKQLMEEEDLAYITLDSLDDIQQELATAIANNKDAVDKAVQQAIANTTNKHNMARTELISQHAVDSAEYKADIKALTNEVNQLKSTNARLNEMIDEERQARVETAKYNQTIVQQTQPLSK